MSNEYNKQYLKERRQWLHEHHFCVDCKKQDAYTLVGKWRCYECKERARIRRHGQIYTWDKREEMGLCVKCENPVKKGYLVCERHYNQMCELSKKSHKNHGHGVKTDKASNPQIPRYEWVENGFCYLCGDKRLPEYKVCDKCHDRLIAQRIKQKELGQDYKIRKSINDFFILRRLEKNAKENKK